MEKTNIKQSGHENKKLFDAKKLLNLRNLNKSLFLAIVILAVYYVAGVNDLATKGFALSELKQQENKLIEANNKLELEAMTLSSYGQLSQRVAGLKMVAVGEINYLSDNSGTVARR